MVASNKGISKITKNYSLNRVRENHSYCIVIALSFVVFILSLSTTDTSDPILPIVSAQGTSSDSCPELPNDGRPQPKNGANTDSKTWKVAPMKKDPNGFKVVDSDGINVADRFDSKANAEQYIAHFVCNTSQSPTETGTEVGGSPSPNDDAKGSTLPTAENHTSEPGPTSPDSDAGNPPVPDQLQLKIIVPQKCVEYELFEPPTVKAKTCAQIVEDPLAPKYKIVASAQQWVDGNKVYDDSFPKDPGQADCPTPAPCRIKGQEFNPTVFKNVIGDSEVTLYLKLDTDHDKLDLEYNKCQPNSSGGKICEPATTKNILTWASYLTKWFSMNVNDIKVRYQMKNPGTIQEIEQKLETYLNEDIKKYMDNINTLYGSKGTEITPDNIKINFTKPRP